MKNELNDVHGYIVNYTTTRFVSNMPSLRIQRVQAQQGTPAALGRESNPVQQIPATDFIRHDVAPDGDCLFRSLLMSNANRSGLRVSDHQVMELRQKAANYVLENQDALIANPSFGDVVGVHNLRDLLLRQGQWAGNAGDLVPPILARILGREVRILVPSQQAGFYEANNNRYYNPHSEILPSVLGSDAGSDVTVKPPIYLLHIDGSHYDCLTLNALPVETVSQSDIKLHALHKYFGIDGQNMMTLERWSNDEWGDSTFMQLSDQLAPVCVNKSLVKLSLSDTEFGNAVGGNAEGHRSELGMDRYVKVTPDNGNFFLLVNRGSEAEVDSLKTHLNNPDNNDSATVMSCEYQYQARIASVSSHNGQEYIEIGASRSHGQSKYSVYRLVGHQSKSIEQAKALVKSEKGLFDDIGMEQNLNPQRRDGPIEQSRQSSRKRTRDCASRTYTSETSNNRIARPRVLEVTPISEDDMRALRAVEEIRNRMIQSVLHGVTGILIRAFIQASPQTSSEALSQLLNQALNQSLNQSLNQVFPERISRNEAADPSHSEVLRTSQPTMSQPTELQAANILRVQIMGAFTQLNDRPFAALTEDEQRAEITRIAQVTNQDESVVRAVLNNRGNRL